MLRDWSLEMDTLPTADQAVQRLVLAFPATLYGSPAWDPRTQQLFLTTSQGYARAPGGLDALAVTAERPHGLDYSLTLHGKNNERR